MYPPPLEKMSHRSSTSAAHLLRRAERERVLGVDAAAVEHQPIAVVPLQGAGLHARRRALDRVEDIEPDIDQA
jgi:hypothetical protein